MKTLQSYQKQLNKPDIKKQTFAKSDKIQISSSAREFQLASVELKKLPEIREDKVNNLKIQIKNGTYQVSIDKLAKAMLER